MAGLIFKARPVWICTQSNIAIIFNNVLIQADKMYLRALNNGLVGLGPSVEFFSIAKLPTIVTVSNSCIRIHACSPIKNSGINLPVDV